MSETETTEVPTAETGERRRNDQALPSIANWTPPWEGQINQPRPVDRPERAHVQEQRGARPVDQPA